MWLVRPDTELQSRGSMRQCPVHAELHRTRVRTRPDVRNVLRRVSRYAAVQRGRAMRVRSYVRGACVRPGSDVRSQLRILRRRRELQRRGAMCAVGVRTELQRSIMRTRSNVRHFVWRVRIAGDMRRQWRVLVHTELLGSHVRTGPDVRYFVRRLLHRAIVQRRIVRGSLRRWDLRTGRRRLPIVPR